MPGIMAFLYDPVHLCMRVTGSCTGTLLLVIQKKSENRKEYTLSSGSLKRITQLIFIWLSKGQKSGSTNG